MGIAKSGQTIGFAAGLNGTIGLLSEHQIGKNGVSILTIDGTGASISVSGNHQNRVFEILSQTKATINNLTIENGLTYLNPNNQNGDGGGILVDANATLNLKNDTIVSNQAQTQVSSAGGGGLANLGTVNINGAVTFGYNSSQGNGGAIENLGALNFNNGSSSNVNFNNNSATLDGGAIYSESSGSVTLSLNYVQFQNNSAQSGNGGAIATMDPLTVNDSSFINDSATNQNNGSDAGYGGAIYSAGSGQMQVQNTYFYQNQAVNNGGAIDTSNTTTVTNTIRSRATKLAQTAVPSPTKKRRPSK